MKKLLVLSGIISLYVISCTKSSYGPENATPSNDKKQSTVVSYPVVNVPSTDWDIKADTSYCGSMILKWRSQPKPSGTVYVILSTPLFQTTTPCSGGLNTQDTVLYYQYGAGCSFFPSKNYSVKITYSVRDTVQKKVFVYTSNSDTISTGRGIWNCN